MMKQKTIGFISIILLIIIKEVLKLQITEPGIGSMVQPLAIIGQIGLHLISMGTVLLIIHTILTALRVLRISIH